MSLLVAVLTVVLLAVVIAVISAPLRATSASSDPEHSERADLQAARESKYREIRDAELDYRTGKLSHEDFQTINHALRGEAMEILDRIESEEGRVDGLTEASSIPGADGESGGRSSPADAERTAD
jgi:hypothetical protein